MPASLVFRRQLRGASTETALWHHLRGRRFASFKFRRQHPCGPFVLDFFCATRRLAIELDGGQHFQHAIRDYDARRTRYLVRRGITVLRFPTDLVLRERDGVLAVIAEALGIADPSP